MTVRDTAPERDSISKGTLFCPDCGHRSRYDGDWVVVEAADRLRYHCPDCRTRVTDRWRYDGDSDGPVSGDPDCRRSVTATVPVATWTDH